jgi:hypothetical protein
MFISIITSENNIKISCIVLLNTVGLYEISTEKIVS